MAGEVGAGAIGAGDSLRWVSLDDMLGGRIHDLVCLHPCVIHIVARSCV